MTTKIPARLIWAVETLAVAPDDQILEIGCGGGVAASLICEKLTTGKLTAIDRSDKMIAQAAQKYAVQIEAGRVDFRVAALDEMAEAGLQFNKIFAVNVNLFWTQTASESEGEMAILKSLLREEGTLYIFYEPPDQNKAEALADSVSQNLETNGFTIEQVAYQKLGAAQGVCICAGVPA